MTPAFAGTTGGLSGTVSDTDTKKPIAGATVSVVSPSQSLSTKTDAHGHFTFVSLIPDTYVVAVEKQGYESATLQGITVLADQTQTLAIPVKQKLEEIGHATAEAPSNLIKPGTTADVYSVSAAQQSRVAALGGGGSLNSAYSGIASVPGVFIPQGQSGWAQSVFVRGGNYTQLGYEYDGVPIQRAFDQYPGSNLSTLGQQELQVYTGAAPPSAQSDGIAGFVNQVIMTGQYPGSVTLTTGIGSPTFDHELKLEATGGTTNRNFTYYLGMSGYDQDFRYGSQYDGSEYDKNYGSPYNLIAANCGTINASIGCYQNDAGFFDAFPAGPSGVATGPFDFGISDELVDRENVANFHFALPHKNDSGKDDIQLLFNTTFLRTYFADSFDDWTYAANNVANGTATYDGQFYPNCGPGGYAGTPCALLPGNQAAYIDNSIYTGPVGSPLTAANLNQTEQYYFPNSSQNRAPGSIVPPGQQDTDDNRSSIVKLQYQKNMGTDAFFRLYGYTFYSDWLENGASGISQYFVGSVEPDYELISHTRGLGFTFADQLDSKNLLNFSGGYTYAATVRWNNEFYAQSAQNVAVLVDSTHPTNGICYSAALAPVACSSSSVAAYQLPAADSPVAPLAPSAGAPSLTAASGLTCGSGPCEYYTVESGLSGPYNTVAPAFSNLSIDDAFHPTPQLLLDLGLHYDDFRYNLGQTLLPAGPLPGPENGTARLLFGNSFEEFNCSEDGQLITITTPGDCPAGSTPAVWSNASPNANDYNAFEPRVGLTYTVSKNDVFRGSYGKYLQPASTAFQQYNNAQNDLVDADKLFYALGYTDPTHQVYPETSYNLDFSWEHQVPHSDISWKVTPFLRKTDNQIFSVLIDPQTNFSSGVNVGRETAQGVEFEVQKGSFDHNGFAAQLNYTYTWATTLFGNLASGATVVDGVNDAIKQYNAYTSYCASNPNNARCGTTTNGVTAAACYNSAGAPDPSCTPGDIANPYWNAPPQGLLSPTAEYPTYNQLPGTGISSVASSFVIPEVVTLLLNYKHDKFAMTPTLQFSGGGRYGSPVEGQGIDPAAGGCAALPGVTSFTGDTRYPYGAAGGAPYDAETCTGVITTPDFATGGFDSFGAFTEPSQLTGDIQFRYDVSDRVSVSLTASNVYNLCFGGSKEPWTAGVSDKIGCWYTSPGYYVGNFYNPGNAISPNAQAYVPTVGNVFQDAYGGQANPFQAVLNVSIKL
ncbi:MAG TPA: TonB-dependent receptor [Candidatus Acidoferrales bacterium]|nr:TonB-dependent receptor [Candidatus Acidoferrales bacterium]